MKNTIEIGFIKILHTERIQDGIERIAYSTGQYALKAVQQKEELIQQLSQTLNAPVDKLLPTTKHLLEEWRETRRNNERLEKALARETADILERAEIEGFLLVSGVISWASTEQGLISVSNEQLKDSSSTIAIAGGIIGNKARIIVSLGSDAVKMGVNASEIAAESGAILGGGGNGSASFAQAGGPKTEKLRDALEAAKKAVRRRLTGQTV